VLGLLAAGMALAVLLWRDRTTETEPRKLFVGVRLEEGRTYELQVTRRSVGNVVIDGRKRARRAEAVERFSLTPTSVEKDGLIIADLTIRVVSLEVDGALRDPPGPITTSINIKAGGALRSDWGIGVPSAISRTTRIMDSGQFLPFVEPGERTPGDVWRVRWDLDVAPNQTADVLLEGKFLGYSVDGSGREIARVTSSFGIEEFTQVGEVPLRNGGTGFVEYRLNQEPFKQVITFDATTGELISMSAVADYRVVRDTFRSEARDELIESYEFDGRFYVAMEVLSRTKS
jgi:hypothetical protein